MFSSKSKASAAAAAAAASASSTAAKSSKHATAWPEFRTCAVLISLAHVDVPSRARRVYGISATCSNLGEAERVQAALAPINVFLCDLLQERLPKGRVVDQEVFVLAISAMRDLDYVGTPIRVHLGSDDSPNDMYLFEKPLTSTSNNAVATPM